MPQRKLALLSIATLLACCVAGCSKVSPGSISGAHIGSIQFTSPAITEARLPAKYTCDGANVAPPLSWGAVPPETREVTLFALALTPNAKGHLSVTVDWAMAGVNPSLHRLVTGERPPGAFLERTSSGARRYSVCPASGEERQYEFVIFAVPSTVTVTPSISGVALFNALALPDSEHRAFASGQIATLYKRG